MFRPAVDSRLPATPGLDNHGSNAMGSVVANMSMSLDGFVAGPNDEVDHVLAWYNAGSVEAETENPDITVNLTPESAEVFRPGTPGALSVGAGCSS